MHPSTTLDRILSGSAFAPGIVEARTIKAVPPQTVPFPQDLNPSLAGALRSRGVAELYSHQGAVWEAARQGRSVVVVTPTASGKTLCYNLPVLHTLLETPQARALYLFPTKALSQDQQAELSSLLPLLATPLMTAVYDGDTPDSLRISLRSQGRIILSNPDMLHVGILPNHPKWIRFFSALRFVVIDEAHTYRGVLGSHVAEVLRRLRRIAAFYGAFPQFILCSATIANPQELAETLIGSEAVLVDKNGAPQGEKRLILYNPPLIDPVQGIRRSVVGESQRWMLAFLKAGIKTILFAHSRIKTEVAASYVNQGLANLYTGNSRIRVEAYRGGLLPNERREIERGLRDGAVQGVVSTNALELGIDIGGLDASISAGFPGSFSSFWQQSGRAGRRGGLSVSVLVASASPLDQFIMQNPQWFFMKGVEEARLDPENPYILTDHIKCAAFELPFRDGALETGEDPFGKGAAEVLAFLEEAGVVRHPDSRSFPNSSLLTAPSSLSPGAWYWADRSYPAQTVNLRCASAENVVILDVTKGRNAVIGEMDRPSAKELIFQNAVYLHRGRQYLVQSLDIENHRCLVAEAEVNYFTDGLVKRDLKVLTEDEFLDYGPAGRGVLGDVLVRSQVVQFKKIRFHTHENIGYGEVTLPEEELQTRALVLLFPPSSAGGRVLARLSEEEAGAALAAAGTLIKAIAPVFLLCDSRDIGVAERVRDPHFGVAALYVYDQYPGGTGLAEALARRGGALFASIRAAADRCPCQYGCPSCVGAGGNKAAAAGFLAALDGKAGKIN